MIKRNIETKLHALMDKFPVITITGPRQSGKTTLVKMCFPNKAYMSLEDPDNREFAFTDPKAFLAQFPDGAILDEVQRCPDLFSYIQTIVDTKQQNGLFILTGSQHFLLLDAISQSLAGRTAILKLLPFCISELSALSVNYSLKELIVNGFYPRLYHDHIQASDLYPNYIETYIERDVRTIKKVTDLQLFYKFVKLLAGRTGQLVNYVSLGNDCGISHTTVKEWISLLETSFIIYTHHPYFVNYHKRIVKSPKVYFCDTGLLCSLLGITDPKDYDVHFLKGGIFENFVLNEVKKFYFNQGIKKDVYFWRDKSGHEVDLFIEGKSHPQLIEIKAAETFNHDFLKNINYIGKISNQAHDAYIITSSDNSQKRSNFSIISWKEITSILA